MPILVQFKFPYTCDTSTSHARGRPGRARDREYFKALQRDADCLLQVARKEEAWPLALLLLHDRACSYLAPG